MDEEIDKKSVNYFITQMTQEEFTEMIKYRQNRGDFETGWTRDERYLWNKIRSDHIQKQDNKNG